MKEQPTPTRIKCPECGQGELVSFTQTEEFDFDLGEETVPVRAENVPVEKCDKCGEEMSGPEAARIRHEAICRAIGLMTPSEIKALREEFGWSQQYLADLTDFGIATVSRWERGRLLQNRSANRTLVALRDCPPFREYLERLLTSKTQEQEARLGSQERIQPTAATPVDRIELTKAAVTRFDQAFEGVREELESLKRQLADLDAGRPPFIPTTRSHAKIS